MIGVAIFLDGEDARFDLHQKFHGPCPVFVHHDHPARDEIQEDTP